LVAAPRYQQLQQPRVVIDYDRLAELVWKKIEARIQKPQQIDYDLILSRIPEPKINYTELATLVKPQQINYVELIKQLPQLAIDITDESGQSVAEIPFELLESRYVARLPPIKVRTYTADEHLHGTHFYPYTWGIQIKPLVK